MTLQIVDTNWVPFNWNLSEEIQEVNSGKTKLVYPFQQDTLAIVHRNIITANDDPIYTGEALGKWVASAYSTALLFKRIEEKWIHTSHVNILNSNTTIDKELDMLPFEIIWRRYNVDGNSWMKRNPNNTYKTGERYDDIIYEACLKWSVQDVNGQIIHDPFLVLDENFEPILDKRGLPRLMDSKTEKELFYDRIIHPNKHSEIDHDTLRETIENFKKYAQPIREMTQTVQETTLETYGEIGLINADGKIEVWVDKDGILTLWDELELDSLRNMSIQNILTQKWELVTFDSKTLGIPFEKDFLTSIQQIQKSFHSGKQAYRNEMKIIDWQLKDWNTNHGTIQERQSLNHAPAQRVTDEIYIPVAHALSVRFWRDVGYILEIN